MSDNHRHARSTASEGDRPRLAGGASVSQIALVALAVFVFSIPAENGVSIPGVGSLSRLIGIVALGIALIALVNRGTVRLRAPSLFLVAAVVFVAWTAVTYFWSIAPAASLSRAIQYLQLLAFAWMVHQLAQTERDRDVLVQSFVLGCYAMIAVAIAASLGTARGGYRDVGFPANSFAIVASLAIPMAWGLVVRRPFPLAHALNTVYPVLALVAVVLAASRGGLLVAIVGLTVIPLTMHKLGLARRMLLVAGVAAVAVSMFTWLPNAIPDLDRNFERLGRVQDDLIDGTMTGRTRIWAAGFEVFLESPIVGVGAGAYGRAVEPILGSARSAHNAFLSVAATSGLVGLLLFVAMFVVVLIGLVSNRGRRIDHFVLLAAVVLAMMPANAENNKFLWFALATLSSARPLMLAASASLKTPTPERPQRPRAVPAPASVSPAQTPNQH